MSILSFFYLYIPKICRNFALVIELERHIEILLLSNDCVIVPDLGGFMAHHIDAHHDETDNLFLPPMRTLGFNPQLKINDSLLVQSYIEAYDISYPEALQRITDEVRELKMQLNEEGFYELNDIGVLKLNEDGNCVFTPCEAGILTPSLYGLDTFEISLIHAAKPQVVEKTEEPEEEPKAKILGIDTISQTETAEDDDDDVVRIKFSWIRNTVAVAAVLLAVFILALPTGKTEMMTRTISNLNNNILFGMMAKDTNTSKIEIKKIEPISTCKAPEKKVTEEKQERETLTRDAFCIVLASYITQRNAEIFVNNLQQKGYDKAEVYNRNNVTRVIYGKYATEAEAYTDLKQIHKDKSLAEAWVMKLKAEKP